MIDHGKFVVPATTRSKLMLEVASELVGGKQWVQRQATISLRPQGRGNWPLTLFASDDPLADALLSAGTSTGETVWRMPLGPDYDKLIDSKFADIKNIGGRTAGAVTAAQFLQRFVGKTPWAHIDLAGTAIGSPQTEINQSWASGWGVRLLDRMVSDKHEG